MKLTGFGQAIADVEAERLTEAQANIDAGWTEADHPEKCCPTETPLPRTIKTLAERREWCLIRAASADRRARDYTRLANKLENDLTPDRRADHGEINIPMVKRATSIDSDVTKAAQLIKARAAIANHQTRADHWRKKAEATK